MAFDLKTFVTHNWPVKLTALALATLLWLAVRAEQPATHLIPVAVIVDPPPGMVVASAPPPVQAMFTGPTREIFKLFSTPPEIRKIIPPTHEGMNFRVELNIQDLTVSQDARVSVQDLRPRAFDVQIDTMVSKRVPVQAIAQISPDSGFEIIGNVSVLPDSVSVEGPAGLLRTITHARTPALELAGVRETFTIPVPIDTTGVRGAVFTPASIDLRATVRAAAIRDRIIAGVPITVQPQRGGVWAPDRPTVLVTVTGPSGRLQRITSDSVRVVATPTGEGPVETVRLTIIPPNGFTAQASPDSITVRRRDRA